MIRFNGSKLKQHEKVAFKTRNIRRISRKTAYRIVCVCGYFVPSPERGHSLPLWTQSGLFVWFNYTALCSHLNIGTHTHVLSQSLIRSSTRESRAPVHYIVRQNFRPILTVRNFNIWNTRRQHQNLDGLLQYFNLFSLIFQIHFIKIFAQMIQI